MDLALAIELDAGRGALGVVDPEGTVLDNEPLEGDTERAGWDGVRAALEALDRLRARSGRIGGDVVVCGVGMELGDEGAVDELRARLRELTGLAVYVDDPGRAFALAEGWVGAAKGVDHFAAVEIGQTVRGGIVLDGRLLGGALGHAGRLGHVIVAPDGRRCACGARGCLQAEVSVPAIEATTGRALSEPAYEGMQHVGRLVGIGLASVANLLDLKLLVCGGRVAREYSSTMFLAAQEELDTRCRLAFSRGARIVPARTPEPAGLIAAAAVAWRGLAA